MAQFYINLSLRWNGETFEEVTAELEDEINDPGSMLFQTQSYVIEEQSADLKYMSTDKVWVKKVMLGDMEIGEAYFYTEGVEEDGPSKWIFTPTNMQYFTASKLHHIADLIDDLINIYPNPFKEA